MKVLFMAMTFLLVQACDQPTRTRFPTQSGTVGTSGTDNPGNVTDPGASSSSSGGSSSSSSGGSSSGGNTDTTEPGFESCNLGFVYYKQSIGHFGLCQNQNNESSFKLKMGSTDINTGTCFVPVHITSAGSSYKVGGAECVHNEANKTYPMILRKTAADPINGVMVIKANALGSYMQCMSAKVDFMNQYPPRPGYPGCQNDPYCVQAANRYATDVCNSFVQNYKNYYLQVNLP